MAVVETVTVTVVESVEVGVTDCVVVVVTLTVTDVVTDTVAEIVTLSVDVAVAVGDSLGLAIQYNELPDGTRSPPSAVIVCDANSGVPVTVDDHETVLTAALATNASMTES